MADDTPVNELQKILASDAESYDQFGYSVAINGDYAIIGAYRESSKGADVQMPELLISFTGLI